jgi:nucleoside-diphosphate-sugar epimerase
VDNLSTGKRANLAAVPSAEFIEGDLADPQVAERAVAGMDYVLHQAAIPSVPRSVKDPATSNRSNITATLNVLVAARDAGVKRLVYAASSSAYGNTATLPKREDMPANPLSPYALQKFVGEQYCQMFTKLYGFSTVSIRYFNVFGPRQDPGSPYSGVISLFAAALLAGRRPSIQGDGSQTRDFTYVANVVDGVLRACEAPAAAGEVINVATGARDEPSQRHANRTHISGSASRGRARLTGRHLEGASHPGLRAPRLTQRRPEAHARLVQVGPPRPHPGASVLKSKKEEQRHTPPLLFFGPWG